MNNNEQKFSEFPDQLQGIIIAFFSTVKLKTAEEFINKVIAGNQEILNTNLISDTYHTFGELYNHRITLYITLCRVLHQTNSIYPIWRCNNNDGWFLLGIGTEKRDQITYHLPISRWDDCWFAEELSTGPAFDGHTSADVLFRLSHLDY